MQTGVTHSYSYGGLEKTPRQSIVDLEAMLMQHPDNMTSKEATAKFVTHYYAPGTYARHMTIAKNMCIVGKIHKHAHINLLMRGKVKVVTPFGDDFLEGPHIWVSEPGTKRALVALTDLDWVTVHSNPDDLDDPDLLEDQIVVDTFEELDTFLLERGDIT